jgi:hypothetical protein
MRPPTIRAVRRYPVLLATLLALLLAAAPRLRALTDEEKKQEFLEARGDDSGTSPSPSPSPTPHHKKHPAPEATPHHKHSPTPSSEESPTPEETPEPSESPTHKRHHTAAGESPTPEETPKPSESPAHKRHHIAAEESPTPEETPEPDVTPHKHNEATAEESETPAHKRHHPSPTPESTPRKHLHPEEEQTPIPLHHEPTPTPSPEETPIPQAHPVKTPAPPEPEQVTQATPIPGATPAPAPPPGPWGAQVDIQKEGLEQEGGFEPPPPSAPVHHHWWQIFSPEPEPTYHFLTKDIRDAIDRAPVIRHRWRFIVVHNSGTRQGNARIFDYYHRYVRKMPNGLAYHFVIGNGTSSGNGQIEIGGRWTKQLQGGHVHSDYLNNIALGICLVGDFNRDLPTREQLEALDELIRYLRIRVGKIDGKPAIVKAHKEINPPRWPTDCPGDRFPYHWLHERFD